MGTALIIMFPKLLDLFLGLLLRLSCFQRWNGQVDDYDTKAQYSKGFQYAITKVGYELFKSPNQEPNESAEKSMTGAGCFLLN